MKGLAGCLPIDSFLEIIFPKSFNKTPSGTVIDGSSFLFLNFLFRLRRLHTTSDSTSRMFIVTQPYKKGCS